MASVKTYPGPDGGKQLLSREARAKRNKDNIAKASEQYRIDRRSENQATGKQNSQTDLHHTKSGTIRRTSIAYNRATKGPKYRNEVRT